MKKEIIRTCIVTGKRLPQAELLRIAKLSNGKIVIDVNQELEGRGCYFELNDSNIDVVIKSKLINRSFRENIDSRVYDKLKDLKNER